MGGVGERPASPGHGLGAVSRGWLSPRRHPARPAPMPLTTRRSGFTLAETLVALVLLGLTLAVVVRVLIGQHRLAATASERAALQANLRSGLSFLRRELWEVAAAGDLLAIGPDSLSYRAIRGSGVACAVSSTEVRVRMVPWSGFRQPQPSRDSLLLFAASDTGPIRTPRWATLPITSVSTATCAGAPALVLGTTIDPAVGPPASIRLDTPIRTFEVMQLRLYRAGTTWWLGARSLSAGETIQPLLGPLEPNGLRLTYLDSAGVPTTIAGLTRSVWVTLRGVSSKSVRPTVDALPIPLRDSATGWLPLRNLEP